MVTLRFFSINDPSHGSCATRKIAGLSKFSMTHKLMTFPGYPYDSFLGGTEFCSKSNGGGSCDEYRIETSRIQFEIKSKKRQIGRITYQTKNSKRTFDRKGRKAANIRKRYVLRHLTRAGIELTES